MDDNTDAHGESTHSSKHVGGDDASESGDGAVNRRTFLNALAATGALGAVSPEAVDSAAASESSEWEKKPPQIETPWTEEVGPDNARPEYPRPQMVREHWKNLNGVWQFAGASEGESPPFGEDLDERILVPYPVESGLSGIKRHETRMWYRRTFEVPDDWIIPSADPDDGENNPNRQRLLAHFERVDWEATVYVNGEEVTTHQGGYDHFVADVTDHLIEGGPQELVVGVFDPTAVNTDPAGTQPKGRQGVGTGYEGENSLDMTPTSGIWDTVWLEPVPEAHVEGLDMTPDLENDALRLTVEASADDATVVATAYDENDEKAGRVIGPANEELELVVEDPRLWTPEDPFLYDLDVKLRRKQGAGAVSEAGGGKLLDRVESYFGMRSIGKREVAGTSRPTLNGEMVWHLGTLESGQWPDGLYTAPTDEALRTNLELQKELGYNMVRKHVKVEPRRWFYHADRLGLLVWQDMPHMHESFDTPPRDEAVLEHFKSELREVVTEHDNHPSMAVWIPINEGWGIDNQNHDFIRELVDLVSELDPERLVDANSGYNIGSNTDSGAGDVKDLHWYGTPSVIAPNPDPDRVSALGEYTTASLVVEDHKWGECGSNASPERFLEDYLESVDRLRRLMVGRRLSASVYTATTDLENVCNGMITYDREVLKPARAENGLERVRRAHEALIEQSKRVMGNFVVDVEAPSTYVSGDLLGNAKPFDLTVTVTNPESAAANAATVENVSASVSSDLPDDWSIGAATDTSFDAVPDGESASATWEVTPDSTADGDVALDVTVAYEIAGESYEYSESVTVSAAQLAYWRFENDASDSSSFDNSLALGGDAGFEEGVAAEGDYSLALDGDGDYAQISAFGDGILHDAFTQRTVAMWVNPDSTTGTQVLYNEGGHVNGLGLRIRDGSLEAIAANGERPGTVSTPFDRTEWTHVAVVFDRGALRLYVDGEQAAANEDVGYARVPGHVAGSELGGNTTTTPWANDDQPHFFAGNLDATGVYRSALAPEDVAAIARRSFSVEAPRLYAAGSDPDPFEVAATFSDLPDGDGTTFENLSMSVAELPEGWSSAATSDTEFEATADGETVTATWDVTPSASADGAAEIEVAVEYDADGERRRLVDGATLDTLSSAALAEWRFNDSTADSSGNGHDATLENGASFDGQTVVEGSHSVALDGQDDFVDLAEGGEDFLSQSFSERTVSMWIRPESTDGSQVLYNEGAAFNGMAMRINDGELQATTISDGTQVTIGGPFDRTDWTHVAVVFDRGAFRLYADGEELAANEDVGFETTSGGYWGGEFGGSEVFPWSGNFGGNVDVSAMYPFALTPEQISTVAGAY